jgi:hypothetical protein
MFIEAVVSSGKGGAMSSRRRHQRLASTGRRLTPKMSFNYSTAAMQNVYSVVFD